MCSPEHEIELIIIAELLYMNMRGKRKSLAVGLGVQRTEEKTTGVSCVDLLLRAGMKRVQREQRGLGGARGAAACRQAREGQQQQAAVQRRACAKRCGPARSSAGPAKRGEIGHGGGGAWAFWDFGSRSGG